MTGNFGAGLPPDNNHDNINEQSQTEVAKTISVYHSVELEEDSCKGCTICVTGCPVEAIRVHDGKAHILEERCIDCGECIRRCPNHAKQAKSPELTILDDYNKRAALVPPSFYAQFECKYSEQELHTALKLLGFTDIFNVADDATIISQATTEYLKNTPNLPKPVISSSCPTIIKLIQVRFPSLIDNLLPLLPPVELTARRARKTLQKTDNTSTLSKVNKIGVFFISPCPAKMTVARSPVGYKSSGIDGVFSISALYLPVLNALKKAHTTSASEFNSDSSTFTNETTKSDLNTTKSTNDAYNPIIWSRECGEAESIIHFSSSKTFNWLSAGGIKQAIDLLEAIDDGQYSSYDFTEIAACSGGCIGGPLSISTVPEAQAVLRSRLSQTHDNKTPGPLPEESDICLSDICLTEQILPRPSRKLSNDFKKARRMMEKQEEIITQLPGLDCGSCGSPNCKALAEDIVRGNAKIEDCVTILKAHYEKLLFGK